MRNRHRYPDEWYSTIRPQQLANAKFKCGDCFVKQASFGYYDKSGKFVECDSFMGKWAKEHGFKPKRVYLQVCHLDQNPDNNKPDNLAVKCPRCHLRHDNEYNRLSRIADKATR